MRACRSAVNPRNLLLGTASAMALSIGTAEATMAVTDYNSPNMQFFFANDEKKVWFDASECDGCGSATLSPLGGPDFGFRISFGPTENIEAGVTAVIGTSISQSDSTTQSLLINVMTNDPLMRIVGATLGAQAGVSASYDYQANGEDGSRGFGSAGASGDIDLDLFNGSVIADLDGIFDASVSAFDLQTSDDTQVAGTTSVGGPVSGALAPSVMQTMTLRWSLSVMAECDTIDVGRARCDADAMAFIDYVDIRFIQERIPEPGTIGLLGAGLAGLSWMFRRRRKPPGT